MRPYGWMRCDHVSHLPLHERSVLPALPACSLQRLHALDSLIQQGRQLIALACSIAAPCSCTTAWQATPVSGGLRQPLVARAGEQVSMTSRLFAVPDAVLWGPCSSSCLPAAWATTTFATAALAGRRAQAISWDLTEARTAALWACTLDAPSATIVLHADALSLWSVGATAKIYHPEACQADSKAPLWTLHSKHGKLR